MSPTGVIPLHAIPSRANNPQRLPDANSSATSGSAVISPQPPNLSQAVPQVNQAKSANSKRRNFLLTGFRACASWVRSHPLLSIGGLLVALVTLFVGYSLTSEGNRLAGTALDYTRYVTWCQNSSNASNYTWCQKHQTPDTFDPAFKSDQRRNIFQLWNLVKITNPVLSDGNNYWFGGMRIDESVVSPASVFLIAFRGFYDTLRRASSRKYSILGALFMAILLVVVTDSSTVNH